MPIICCPHCQSTFPSVAGYTDADGKAFAHFLGTLSPDLSRSVEDYLSLWKPKKTRLPNRRALKIATEVVELVKVGLVNRDNQSHATTEQDWCDAMDRMFANKPSKLPIDGHGYLRDVVVTIVLKRINSENQLGYEQRLELDREVAKREASLRAGRQPEAAPTQFGTREKTPEEIAEEQAAFERMMSEFEFAPSNAS